MSDEIIEALRRIGMTTLLVAGIATGAVLVREGGDGQYLGYALGGPLCIFAAWLAVRKKD